MQLRDWATITHCFFKTTKQFRQVVLCPRTQTRRYLQIAARCYGNVFQQQKISEQHTRANRGTQTVLERKYINFDTVFGYKTSIIHLSRTLPLNLASHFRLFEKWCVLKKSFHVQTTHIRYSKRALLNTFFVSTILDDSVSIHVLCNVSPPCYYVR